MGRLVAGEAEHHALVTLADQVQVFLVALFGLQRLADAPVNIRALVGNGREHTAGVAVEVFLGAVVADVEDHLAGQFVQVDEGVRGDFAQQHHEAGLGDDFAGHARHRFLLEAGVQYGIRDLVAELIGVALGDRFRGEHQLGRRHSRKSCGNLKGDHRAGFRHRCRPMAGVVGGTAMTCKPVG